MAGRETPWSIVVGIASFLSQIISGGLVGTSGLYYPFFKSAFHFSGMATSWLCSMTFVGYFIGNSIGSILVNRFGYRVGALIGGLMSSLGVCLCLVAPNFYILFFCYGILGCVGNGIQAVAFLVAIITYFDKHRQSMQVFITVGGGVGYAMYSVLIPKFMDMYGWRGCIFLQGAISLNICVLGMLLFKTKYSEKDRPKRFNLEFSLFFKLPVLLFCVHEYFAMICEAATFVHLPVLVISKGFVESDASIVFLCYAISNSFGKLTYSFPWKVDPIIVYTLTVFTYGIAALCQPFLSSLSLLCVCSGVAGFAGNAFAGYTFVVLLELAGKDFYTDVHGIAFLFRAAGAVTSGPVAGFLYDRTQRYENVFYMIAILITVACLLMLPIMRMKSCIPADVIIVEEERDIIEKKGPIHCVVES